MLTLLLRAYLPPRSFFQHFHKHHQYKRYHCRQAKIDQNCCEIIVIHGFFTIAWYLDMLHENIINPAVRDEGKLAISKTTNIMIFISHHIYWSQVHHEHQFRFQYHFGYPIWRVEWSVPVFIFRRHHGLMFFHILFTRPIGWDNRGIHIGACAFSMRVPLLTRCQVFSMVKYVWVLLRDRSRPSLS